MLSSGSRAAGMLPACTPAPRQSLLPSETPLGRHPGHKVISPAGSSASRLQGCLKT